MSFLFTLKIKFSSKFCKTRVNLAYTASKIRSIMNSFIRDWTKRTSSLLSLKYCLRVIALDFLECVLLNRLGGHSPRKPEQEKRFSKTRIWWLKPFRLFFMSRDQLQLDIVLSTDQHWSAARACLRDFIAIDDYLYLMMLKAHCLLQKCIWEVGLR